MSPPVRDTATAPGPGGGRPLLSRVVGRVLGNRLPTAAMVAGIVLGVLVLAMLTADLWRPLDPREIRLGPELAFPSLAFPMGTDTLGRDMLGLSLHGLRNSFMISFLAALVAVVIGALLGLVAGTFGGRVDAVCMRLVDVFASQSHFLFGLLILVLARPLVGPALAIMLAVGLTHWVATARIVRGEVLSLRERSFITAAINAGATRAHLLRHHHLPNVLAPLGLAFVLTAPHAIFHEAGYSFLGLGMPLESPSLGNVLAMSQSSVLAGGWWVSLFPGLLIFLTAAAVGTLGEWLRDRYDPHIRSEYQL